MRRERYSAVLSPKWFTAAIIHMHGAWNMHHIDNIHRDDLIAFYKRYFFPSNIILAVQGDFVTADMRAKLEKLFDGWTVKQEPVPPFPPVTAKPAPGVYLASKQDVTQTSFALGHLGGELRDPNFPALSVMSNILGGSFSGRLFKNVRTRLGLAYSISGGWGATFDHPGLFEVSGSTKSSSTVDTIQAALNEVNKMRTAEVTDQELDTAKQSVLNSFVFFFDSPSKTLTRVVTYDYYGYPKDFIFQYQKGVQAVTKADVLRVAKQYLQAGKYLHSGGREAVGFRQAAQYTRSGERDRPQHSGTRRETICCY